MRRWSSEGLRLSTLRRQFPYPLDGSVEPTRDTILNLVHRLAPIQSQVPRAPFVTLGSRLPGVAYADLVALFESHDLIKASTLRGTVFTSGREQYAWSQAIAREGRAEQLARMAKLPVIEVEKLLTAVEERAADWAPWQDLLDHARELMLTADPTVAGRADQVRLLLWGQAGLLRRPPDSAWHKRTDVLRRSARTALPELPTSDVEEALPAMVSSHLRAYGPVTTDDICFFLGVRKTLVNRAVAALGAQVITGEGPEGQPMVDWDDEIADRSDEPSAAAGVRLLAEFDGLLMGYAGPGRLRFLDSDQLAQIWNAKNAVCAPSVLSDGRIVARWKTAGAGRQVRVEVRMLPPHPPLHPASFEAAVAALERVLDLQVREVRVAGATTEPEQSADC